jgi:DNA recombination protein RmuC
MSNSALTYLLLALASLNLILLVVLLIKSFGNVGGSGLSQTLRDELRSTRQEQSTAARSLRDELAATGRTAADGNLKLLAEMRESQDARLLTLKELLDTSLVRMNSAREDYAASALALREELAKSLQTGNDAALRSLGEITTLQQSHLGDIATRLTQLTETNSTALDRMREALVAGMKDVQEGNERKLEEMRVTVDEKLHGTLEKRLGESFAMVSERLEAVQRGLGEMQSLATGVGDLKKVLTNVKTRGIWGEYQLRAILEQILTPEQYVENFQPDGESREAVEFAIRLPGRGGSHDAVYLPIDSKFPQEDYLRVVEAAERADAVALQDAVAALARAVRGCARDIHDKYLNPPVTTDFGIMFLPTEGLYAEVLRYPGLAAELQERCHVTIAGPTTLAALLNSLRMGFHTLALERRSSEVWQILGAVKTEFGKFGEMLDKAKKQLATASNTLDDTSKRTRMMEKKLRAVDGIGGDAAAALILGAGEEDGAAANQNDALIP